MSRRTKVVTRVTVRAANTASERGNSEGLKLFGERATTIRRHHVCEQEIRDSLVSVDLVFDPRNQVPLVLINFEIYRATALLDRIHNLLGFGLGTARVVPSGDQQQRGLDLVDKHDGRAV